MGIEQNSAPILRNRDLLACDRSLLEKIATMRHYCTVQNNEQRGHDCSMHAAVISKCPATDWPLTGRELGEITYNSRIMATTFLPGRSSLIREGRLPMTRPGLRR